MSTTPVTYDLGLIIPTREEFEYLRMSVPVTPIQHVDRGYWYEFRVPGGRLGVAHVLFDMGLTATTSAAIRLLTKFDPEVLAVVGIGGGLRGELCLGDVVVGSVLQEYLKAAKVASAGDSRTAFHPAGDGWPLAERLRNFTNHFQYFARDCYQNWIRFARIRGIDADLPFATTPRARPEPVYFVLPIASGDVVLADPAFKGWLLSHDRKRAVIEMEGAGAARAVKEYDRDVALLVLRGISDFADERKDALDAAAFGQAIGAWRRYAAQNAIELLLAFLASPDFPWRRPVSGAANASDSITAPAGLTALPAQRPAGAWDYFMGAARVIEGAAAGLELVRAWRSLHPGSHPDPHLAGHSHSGDDGDHPQAGGSHGHDHASGPPGSHDDHGTAHHDVSHDVDAGHDVDVSHVVTAEPAAHPDADQDATAWNHH